MLSRNKNNYNSSMYRDPVVPNNSWAFLTGGSPYPLGRNAFVCLSLGQKGCHPQKSMNLVKSALSGGRSNQNLL